MKKRIPYFFMLLCVICSSCNLVNSKSEREKTSSTIVFQPFSGFPTQSLKYLEEKIHQTFPKLVVKPPIKLPDKALNYTKKRYRADSLIHYLGNRAKANETIIGLTTKDISISKKGVSKDYGVFGFSLCPGNSGVISTFKIKGKNKLVKLYKLAIHEIGHTKGLPHCNSTNCFMRDAKGKDHFNQLTDFCQNCKKNLRDSGAIL